MGKEKTIKVETKEVNINFVKSQMALKGDTYDSLAKLLGKSKASVHQRLTGHRKFQSDELAIMVEHYNVAIDLFFSK